MEAKSSKSKINKNNPKKIMAISVFFTCIILVAVMFIQFRTIEEVNRADLENLREDELREQVATWKSKYEDAAEQLESVNTKIEEYREEITSKGEATDSLDKELQHSQLLLGTTEVTGEGVEITLSDTSEGIITAKDLMDLINELKFAGAEAISINDVRVISMTDIVDIADRFILIKPRQRLSSPYVVKAIGNQTYLTSTLSLKNSGFIDTHTNAGQSVKMEKQKNITIPKYTGEIKVNYMKEEEIK